MLQKIKDLMQIKELIESIKTNISEQNSEIEGIKVEVSKLSVSIIQMRDVVENFRNSQKQYIDFMKVDTADIRDAKTEFIEEIKDFKVKKTSMQKQMMERADNELGVSLDRIKTDVARYNGLKRDMDAINNSIIELSDEISKFKRVSSNIKASDFEATKFANKVFDADREKIRLMKEVETLKHLISKERRRS
jgi:predicted  nucleic acid-binding Zn-ribbon protein